jgi:hypothetical protein
MLHVFRTASSIDADIFRTLKLLLSLATIKMPSVASAYAS